MNSPVFITDTNVLIARTFRNHVHHQAASEWFNTVDLNWALNPWAESGLLRYSMRQRGLDLTTAGTLVQELRRIGTCHYYTCSQDWMTLTRPFFRRLHGHNQITDAYLLGMAIHDGLTLVTFDTAFLHLAGEFRDHVKVLPG